MKICVGRKKVGVRACVRLSDEPIRVFASASWFQSIFWSGKVVVNQQTALSCASLKEDDKLQPHEYPHTPGRKFFLELDLSRCLFHLFASFLNTVQQLY